MQINNVQISLLGKERALRLKLLASFISYGIPFLIITTIVLLSEAEAWYVLLLPGVILLFAIKTMTAMHHVVIKPDKLVFKRGISRSWKQFNTAEKNSLVYFTSMKRGSTYVLSLSGSNITKIEAVDSPVSSPSGYGTFFEKPDHSPFVMDENILAITAQGLSLKDLRPIHAIQRKYPKSAANITIFFSVESIDEFYRALPRSLREKAWIDRLSLKEEDDQMNDD